MHFTEHKFAHGRREMGFGIICKGCERLLQMIIFLCE